MNKLTFNEFKELMEKANIENKQIYGIIVFKPESFEKDFSEEERSYKVSSRANYFDSRKIGKSLFGDSLDGSDTNVRLDWYMNALPEDKLGKRWKVDYCYLLDLEESKCVKTEGLDNNLVKEIYNNYDLTAGLSDAINISFQHNTLRPTFKKWKDNPYLNKYQNDMINNFIENANENYPNINDGILEGVYQAIVDFYKKEYGLKESKEIKTDSKNEEKTKIIFRKDKEDGDIIAVFAEDIQSNNMIGCYVHLGQHTTMSLDYYSKKTIPATPEEYADLKRELEGIGYNIEVVDKLNESKEDKEYNLESDPGFKEYVRTLLKDGAIDDPEYVNKLSDEEFEDLLTNTWMKDPEIIDIYKSLNESKELEESIKIDDVKDIKDRKFFSILFQLDKLRLFEVNYVMKNIYRGSIGKDHSKFEPYKVVDEITMHTETFEKNKRDFRSIGDAEKVLANYSNARNFYEKWESEIFHALTEEQYKELLHDIDELKNTYNYIEQIENVPDRYGFKFYEEVELSKMKPKNKIGESLDESMAKDAADAINNNDWYNNDKRKQTFEGMLADKIAEKAEELGDDYSEWLDQNTIEKMIEDLKNCEEVKAFYNTLDRLIEMYIEERVDWIRRDDPASRYYGREDLDESKQVNNMKIKFNKTYDKYQVITPDGRVLEEFNTEKEASDWAKNQKDFLAKKESKSNGYDDDYRGNDYWELNDMYNEEGSISKEDLLDELQNRYATQNGVKKAFEEITGEKLEEGKEIDSSDNTVDKIMKYFEDNGFYMDEFDEDQMSEMYADILTELGIKYNSIETESISDGKYETIVETDKGNYEIDTKAYWNKEEFIENFKDFLDELKEIKNEDYTQASNAGAIKVDIIGQPKKKSKKDKEDPALKSLPVQQVLIEDKDYRSADEIYNDLSNLKDDE